MINAKHNPCDSCANRREEVCKICSLALNRLEVAALRRIIYSDFYARRAKAWKERATHWREWYHIRDVDLVSAFVEQTRLEKAIRRGRAWSARWKRCAKAYREAAVKVSLALDETFEGTLSGPVLDQDAKADQAPPEFITLDDGRRVSYKKFVDGLEGVIFGYLKGAGL